MSQRPVLVASKTNQPLCVAPKLFKTGSRNFLLGGTELGGRNEAAKILIHNLRLNKNREIATTLQTDLGSNMRFDLPLHGGHVKARRTIHSIAVEQRQRRNL